jgi:hypothetical protein
LRQNELKIKAELAEVISPPEAGPKGAKEDLNSTFEEREQDRFLASVDDVLSED